MVFNPSSSLAQKDGRAMSTKSKVYGLQLSTSGKEYNFTTVQQMVGIQYRDQIFAAV